MRRALHRAALRLAAGVLAVGLVTAGMPVAAQADPLPAGGGVPATVTADPLPTVQINGVAWSQVVIGNTVYVGGAFTSARPAGSAAGVNETPVSNLLAYDIRTGAQIASFTPRVNGQVLSMAASPDGSRLYIVGGFTAVDGINRWRVAALNPATGAVVGNFAPNAGTTVRSVTASATTVYLGGDFQTVNGAVQPYLAAVSAANGALQSGFAPLPDASVTALTLNPSGSLLVVGGRFANLGGMPAYGMGAVDSATGAGRPWAANQIIRDAGPNANITSLTADADSIYGTGYTYGSGGNFEGTFRADPETGAIIWLSNCRGDHYSAFPAGDVVYDASHSHYCGDSPDGFSQSNPWDYYASTAWTKSVAGSIQQNPLYYPQFDFNGQPAPRLLHWYPVWSVGTATGQKQAAWSVAGNSEYVVYGGEFPAVNGKAQQGLVRFATAPLATNKTAPQKTDGLIPQAVSVTPGEVRIGWQATFDRDHRELEYRVYRNFTSFSNTPVATTKVSSTPWQRRTISVTDTGLPPGSSQTYRVYAFDPNGNNVRNGEVSVVVASAADPYAQAVAAAEPEHWWRMDGATGTRLIDTAGGATATAPAAITGGQPGITAAGTSVRLDGTANAFAATEVSQMGPQTFTVEAWVRTNSRNGGRIVGYGDRKAGFSKTGWTDRHLYLDDAGRVWFGVHDGARRTVSSPSRGYNDNAWHYVVGTLDAAGMTLSIDGQQVAARSDVTSARPMRGHWRVGADTLSGWGGTHADSLAGQVDEVAVYSRARSASEIAAQYAARTGQVPNTPPTASFTATPNGLQVALDAAASSDPDGTIASYAWDFGDGTTGTGVSASRSYAAAGRYAVALTVTDDGGAVATTTQAVTVADPSVAAADSFSRTVSAGWGAAEVGGNWSVSGSAANYAVGGGFGIATAPAPGSSVSGYLNSVTALEQDITLSATVDRLADGGGSYLNVAARGGSSTAYRAKIWLKSTGSVQVQALAVVNGAQTALGSKDVPGLTVAPGTPLRVRVQATGASPTTLRIKVWVDGTSEPAAWTLETTDSTAALQAPAGAGLMFFVSGSAANAPVRLSVDDWRVSLP